MLATIMSGLTALPLWNLSLLLFLAKATIILIAALGVTLAMQRASAGARHLVWLVTLTTLLLAPVLAVWAPLRVAILPASVSHANTRTALPIDGAPDVAQNEASPVPIPEISAPPAPMVIAAVTPTVTSRIAGRLDAMSGVSIFLAIWLTVVVGIFASLAWAGLAVRRIVRHATPLDSADWVNPLFEIADRLGLDEAPRLLRTSEAKMPFACGVLTPTIVLPEEAENWTLDRRRAVLIHELAHVRRHDLLGHTLGRLTCAFYWFHPLVWTAAKKLRNESERACDDLALSCGTRATDYAEHLLDIVTSVRGDSTPLVALAMARRKEFEGRMLAILDPELRHSSPSRRQTVALVGSLTLLSLAVAAVVPVQRQANAAEVPRMVQSSESAQVAQQPVMAISTPKTEQQPAIRQPDTAWMEQVPTAPSKRERAASAAVYSTSTSLMDPAPVANRAPLANPTPLANPAPRPSVDPVGAAVATIRQTGEVAIAELAKAGVHIGMDVASNVLSSLGQSISTKGDRGDKGEKGAKGSKDGDDRAALLAKVLKSDTSASLRRIAAWGLQEYTDTPLAQEALLAALRRDADANVREMSAWALGNGGESSSTVASALTSALRSDASEKVRSTAAWALGKMDDQSSADALAAALGDASADVRSRAAWAIGSIEPRQAPRALVGLLRDKDERTRELAAWALFRISDPSTAPALEAALKTEQNKDVQIADIRAVAAMGDKSIDVLRSLLESSDPRVKSMAVRALAGGRATGPWPWPWPMPRPFP